MQNLKNKTNGQIQQKRNRCTDTENKLVVSSGEKEGGTATWYKSLDIK